MVGSDLIGKVQRGQGLFSHRYAEQAACTVFKSRCMGDNGTDFHRRFPQAVSSAGKRLRKGKGQGVARFPVLVAVYGGVTVIRRVIVQRCPGGADPILVFLDAQGVIRHTQDNLFPAVNSIGVDFAVGHIGDKIPQCLFVEGR